MSKMTLRMALFAIVLSVISLFTAVSATTLVVDSVASVIGITRTTAFSGCVVNSDSIVGDSLVARGLCVSTSPNPTIADSVFKTYKNATPAVTFEPVVMSGLMPSTHYYVRGFVTDSAGTTAYSPQKEFSTSSDNSEAVWSCNTDLTSADTGSVYTTDLMLDSLGTDWRFNQNSGGDGISSIKFPDPTGLLKVPTGGNKVTQAFNENVYIPFTVAASQVLKIDQLVATMFAYKTGGLHVMIKYSTDNFVSDTTTLDTIVLNNDVRQVITGGDVNLSSANPHLNTSMGMENMTWPVDISANANDTLYFRLYVWGKDGGTMLMKNLIVSGMGGAAPVVDSVATVIGVTRTSAFSGCFVSADGGNAITERGLCVSTSENPTTADNVFTTYKNATPPVAFEPVVMSGLTPNTHYYVRAFATNSAGTTYSAEREFTTSANNREVVWSCSSDLTASVAGAVSAPDLVLDSLGTDWRFDQNSGGDGVSSIKFPDPTGLLKVPTGGNKVTQAFNENVYVPFTVTTANVLNINELTATMFAYKTGGLHVMIKYSKDNFVSDTTTLDTIVLNNEARQMITGGDVNLSSANPHLDTSMGMEDMTWPVDIQANAGDTLYFRMYVWGKDGGTMLMKNLTVSGVGGTVPTVDSVASVIGITRTTAFSGCFVSADGDNAITERGLCVSTSSDPTTADNVFTTYKNATPPVAFEPVVMSGLTPNTHYYVRAFATNSAGTSYSATQSEFTTSANSVEAVWSCSTDLTPSVAGDISAPDLVLDKLGTDWRFNQNSGGNGTTSIKFPDPTGLLKVPTGGQLTTQAFNEDVYIPFTVTSTSKLNINELVATMFAYKTGGLHVMIKCSNDNFVSDTTVLSNILLNNEAREMITNGDVNLSSANPHLDTSMGKENMTWPVDIHANAGDTLYFRMYIWGKDGSTCLMKNLVVSGTTGDAPTVDSVASVIGITRTTAFSGCVASADGGNAITERGLCVSTSADPTIADTVFTTYKNATPPVPFEPVVMSGLAPNTHYYVRAFATNVVGTSYSAQKEFMTSDNDVEAMWSCSTDLTASVVGDVTAPDLVLDNLGTDWRFNQNSGGDGISSIKFPDPTGLLKVPTGGQLTTASFNDAVYIPFSVTTTDKIDINKLAATMFAYKTGGLHAMIKYSNDNFASDTTVLDSIILNNDVRQVITNGDTNLSSANPHLDTSMGKENMTWPANIIVDAGATAYFRLYIWGKDGSTCLMKNLIVSGTTNVATGIGSTIANQNNLIVYTYANKLMVRNASNITRFEVYSVNGVLVNSTQNTASEISMDISNLASGVYILRAVTNNGVKTVKFIR